MLLNSKPIWCHNRRIFQRIGGTAEKWDTEFLDAFVYNHAIPEQPGEPTAKMNCFGWYVLGKLAKDNIRIQSVDRFRDYKYAQRIHYSFTTSLIGVKPTKLCTCSDNILLEN